MRLNRRLCPGIYLDVVPVAYVEGKVAVDAAGTVVDYAVKMKRLPEERMMGHLLEKEAITPKMVRGLARRLAEFHASAETGARIEAFGSLETIAGNWRANIDQTETYVGRTITVRQLGKCGSTWKASSSRRGPCCSSGWREGRVRDCHGDLRAEAVCFQDGICIFDCIEFNERFRYSDVAADLAFLAMDLDFRDRPAMSDELVGVYLEVSGDRTLPLVLDFYKCYRAYVEDEPLGFLLDALEVQAAQKAAARGRARAYFRLAHPLCPAAHAVHVDQHGRPQWHRQELPGERPVRSIGRRGHLLGHRAQAAGGRRAHRAARRALGARHLRA